MEAHSNTEKKGKRWGAMTESEGNKTEEMASIGS
jgi:hypothetical protein